MSTRLAMLRCLVERNLPDGLLILQTGVGTQISSTVINNNVKDGVSWVHSYVSPDRKKTFCTYDSPSAEAIRAVADRPIATACQWRVITQVSTFDPYFYRAARIGGGFTPLRITGHKNDFLKAGAPQGVLWPIGAVRMLGARGAARD